MTYDLTPGGRSAVRTPGRELSLSRDNPEFFDSDLFVVRTDFRFGELGRAREARVLEMPTFPTGAARSSSYRAT
jgi:hypothetical protein